MDVKVVELAAAVTRQPIRDASRPDSLESVSARRFLAGSAGFRWWSEVAGLDPASVRLFSRPYYLGLGRTWDISSDGERFLMVKSTAATDEATAGGQIAVVQHWFDELQRLVPTN